MKMEFKLDAREFTQALREYAAVSKKDESEIVLKRASAVLNNGFKRRPVKSLFTEFQKVAPSVQLLQGLPEKLGHRIKVKFKNTMAGIKSPALPAYLAREKLLRERGAAGISKEENLFRGKMGRRIANRLAGQLRKVRDREAAEIMRRINARFASASGWLPAVWQLSKKGVKSLKKIRNPLGSVVIDLKEPSVTLINSMPSAVGAENKHHIMQAVLNDHVRDMREHIEETMAKRSQQFSAK